ncbi:MAG: dTMP kinase [Desulfomonile tiedjei]|nr:dTMP kinase [Desulfomonile tiedjei]
MAQNPLFIVFEGIDGSGKSTQVRLLAARFEACGIPCVKTAEPSTGPFGREIRSLVVRPAPEEEARLFTEDRRDHLHRVILPALKAGLTVVCDRYVYSSVAYQGARGLSPDRILAENRAFAREADVTFLLEIPVPEAMRRIGRGRGNSFSVFEGLEELTAVDSIYRGLKDDLIQRIDGSPPAEEVHERVVQILRRIWPCLYM